MIREGNLWKISTSRGDQIEGEVADIKERGSYHRIRVEGRNDRTPPILYWGGVEVSIMSGERLLDSRGKGMRRNEGVCQEDTGVKGIHFPNGLFPDTVNPPSSVFCAHF